MDVPINDNWNLVSDSKVNSDTVKDLLVDRSASIMPTTGEPLSDAITAGWQVCGGCVSVAVAVCPWRWLCLCIYFHALYVCMRCML